MSSSQRLTAFAITVAFCAIASPALAQSPEEQAEKLNEEGKVLFHKKKDIPAAVKKFQQAVVLSPKAKYYFNLCYGLHQIARYKDSLRACRAVENAEDPTDRQLSNAQKILADLKKRAPELFEPKQGGDGDGDGGGGDGDGDGGDGDGGGGDGDGDGNGGDGDGDGNGGDGGGDGDGDGNGGDGNQFGGDTGEGPGNLPPPGPIAGLEGAAPPPTDKYNWSLGIQLGFFGNGVGSEFFAGTGATTKFTGSYMFSPASRIGVRGFVGLSNIGADSDVIDDSLQIVDIGVSLYKHTRINNLYVTPAVGGHIAAMTPTGLFETAEGFAAPGIHAEAAVSWLFGDKKNHVVSVIPALNIYLPASSSGIDDPADFGLDTVGATFGVTVGYTVRFLEPFGRSPFFTLE